MTTFRNLALITLSGGLIAIGSSMAFALDSDNTSSGESGHGTGCSNAPISASGTDGTNCYTTSQHVYGIDATNDGSTVSGSIVVPPTDDLDGMDDHAISGAKHR
jgi:hypothetical protein